MNSINIRNLQHYLYCPHRWGLIEIGDVWAENYFVVKAELVHKRVHDPKIKYTSKNKKYFADVSVWNDEEKYDLYGLVDLLELSPSDTGVQVYSLKGNYDLTIVEYKPTLPKDKEYNFDDALQVYAQKKCVDYVFGSDCKGVLYYSDAKKRVDIDFESKPFEAVLVKTITEMRAYRERGVIPPILKGQKCNGCSMKDLCIPSLKKHKGIRQKIEEIIGAEE